jgi:hypothetical protein
MLLVSLADAVGRWVGTITGDLELQDLIGGNLARSLYHVGEDPLPAVLQWLYHHRLDAKSREGTVVSMTATTKDQGRRSVA